MRPPTARRPWYFLVLVVTGILSLDQPAHRPTDLLLLGSTHALIAIAAAIIARRLCSPADQLALAPCRIVLTFQIYFAATTVILLILALFGILDRGALFIAAIGFHLAARIVCRRPVPAPRRLRTPMPLVARLLAAALLFVILLTAYRSFAEPRYEYDMLTYHLYFPARWLQDGAISIIPTAFSDPAPAYAPSATEVYFLSFMLPLGDDTVARAGQFPCWLLLLAAVNALGRQLRFAPAVRLGVTLAVALIPAIAWQAGTAMVDIAVAAHFLAVVLFAIGCIWRSHISHPPSRIRHCTTPANALGLLISLALLLSTKFLALAYLLALIPLLLLAANALRRADKRTRRTVLTALVPSLFIAGFWYARNAIVTGNPLFPLDVRVGSNVIFPGAYDRASMTNSPFNLHRHPFRDAVATIAWDAFHDHPYDTNAPFTRWAPIVLIAVCFSLSLWERARVRAGLQTAGLFITPVLLLLVFWCAVPFHQPRFLWPAILLAFVLAAVCTGRGHLARTLFLVAIAVVSAIAFRAEFSEILRAPLWFIILAFAATILCWHGQALLARVFGLMTGRRTRRTPDGPALSAGVSVAAILLAILAGLAASGDARDAAFDKRPFFAQGWQTVDSHLHGVKIAYAGNNLPYFLLGRRFENRAIYVPARAPADGCYHTFVEIEQARGRAPPNTSEPPFDRFEMSPGAWLANLRAAGVQYVFVTNIPPLALVAHRHDAEGFPIERRWLDALCAPGVSGRAFARVAVLAHGGVRLYQLDWTAAPAEWPALPDVHQLEVDALDQARRLNLPPRTPIPEYPLAISVIEQHGLRPLPARPRTD